MSCELLETCIFFNDKMSFMPKTAEMLKQKYCKDAHHSCARYMVFSALGRPKVPADLYPDETEKARRIISAG